MCFRSNSACGDPPQAQFYVSLPTSFWCSINIVLSPPRTIITRPLHCSSSSKSTSTSEWEYVHLSEECPPHHHHHQLGSSTSQCAQSCRGRIYDCLSVQRLQCVPEEQWAFSITITLPVCVHWQRDQYQSNAASLCSALVSNHPPLIKQIQTTVRRHSRSNSCEISLVSQSAAQLGAARGYKFILKWNSWANSDASSMLHSELINFRLWERAPHRSSPSFTKWINEMRYRYYTWGVVDWRTQHESRGRMFDIVQIYYNESASPGLLSSGIHSWLIGPRLECTS